MADLIEREALLSKIEPDEYYHSNEIRDMLRDCPTVTPESLVRHGRWIALVEIEGHMMAECSECHKIRNIDNYCSVCGAKMDLEE